MHGLLPNPPEDRRLLQPAGRQSRPGAKAPGRVRLAQVELEKLAAGLARYERLGWFDPTRPSPASRVGFYFRFGLPQQGSRGGGGFLTGVIVPDPVAFWFGLPQQGSNGFAPPVEPPPPDFACASNAPSATVKDMQAAIVSSLFISASQRYIFWHRRPQRKCAPQPFGRNQRHRVAVFDRLQSIWKSPMSDKPNFDFDSIVGTEDSDDESVYLLTQGPQRL